ncbi:12910_t:CDS:1, partial [Racocetra fulgida]
VKILKQYRRHVNESNQSTEKKQVPKLNNIKRDKTPELDDIGI